MSNPHGTCESCDWHGVETTRDADNLVTLHWLCWKDSGSPEVRLSTTVRTKRPPACENHLSAG